jgi:hypothetical protein
MTDISAGMGSSRIFMPYKNLLRDQMKDGGILV